MYGIGYLPSILSVCPIYNAPFALLLKKRKHFSRSHVRHGRRSVVSSAQVAVVVSLSLPHQQCDNFHNILQDNAKWTGALILYVVLHYLFAPWGPL